MTQRQRQLIWLWWMGCLFGLAGCPLSSTQEQPKVTWVPSRHITPRRAPSPPAQARRCIKGQLKIYKEPQSTQYGVLQLRSLHHPMRFQLANPSRDGRFSFCSLVEVLDADAGATKRHDLKAGPYQLTHMRDGIRASAPLHVVWPSAKKEPMKRWYVARVGENQMAAFAKYRRPTLKLSQTGWPAPLSDPCRLATSHYAKKLLQLTHTRHIHLPSVWLQRQGSNQRDLAYKRWASGRKHLRVRWLHYEPWAMTAHVINPHARTLAFSTKGLYLVPKGKPAHAPQRITALETHCVLQAGQWQARTSTDISPGQGRVLRVPIYSLDPHRDPPGRRQRFARMARLPAAWLRLFKGYRRRCAMARPKHKRPWPLRPTQLQALLWYTRQRHWLSLKGARHQEQAQRKRLLQITPTPTPKQMGCQLIQK